MAQNTKEPKNKKKIGIQNPTTMLKDLMAYSIDFRMPKLMVLNVKYLFTAMLEVIMNNNIQVLFWSKHN